MRIALREKHLPFEAVVPPDFGTGRGDTPFAAANPRREVPAPLAEAGSVVFESAVILDDLEALCPDPTLLPTDPLARAGHRRACRDPRLEWMVRSGGIDIVRDGLRDDTIRFSWPGGEGAPGNTVDTRGG